MRLLFFCIFIFMSIHSFAQEFDKQNIYYQTLKSHFEYIEEQHGKRPDLWRMASIYYIEEDFITTKGFPDFVDKNKIQVLSLSDIKEKTKNKKSINLLAVRPAQWEEGKVIINVIEFSVSRKGNNYSYLNLMDGTSYQIIYNSNTKQYSLIPIK
ncbi:MULTISPECIES: hypothetical protein [unclassified Dysgonomonas]|uniref:hypothetical protein n=1 Tax=unclassified Dysgonomonas TaxID=2630389 RepID=UPI0025C4C7C0|nr:MULTISPECIES: hypothetical protein [unclassified Dysgonomonas]MDR2005158.1 hypothetical protein [Prevotella sp.]HMM04028.1 hypothetical protein [Dysgonomonas sp.]